MQQEIDALKLQVQKLTEIIQGNFNGLNVFTSKVVVKDLLTAENGIYINSKNNPTGIQIRTGAAFTNATIAAEVGTLPDGSMYITSQTLQWPLFIKYNGTWTQVTLP